MKAIFRVIFLVTAMVLVFTINAGAQIPALTNGFESPLVLNPGYAGTMDVPQLTVHLRQGNQPGSIFSSAVSYDQQVEKLRGGFGVAVTSSVMNQALMENLINGIYAYHHKINDHTYLRPAINIGFGFNYFDDSNLQGGTQNGTSSRAYINTGAGVLLGHKQAIAGISVDHLNYPDVGFDNTLNRMPPRVTVHAIVQKEFQDDASLFPGIIYQGHWGTHRFTPSLVFDFRGFRIGAATVHHRVNDAGSNGIAGIAGIQFQSIVVAYSYASRLWGELIRDLPSHEFAITYRFKE